MSRKQGLRDELALALKLLREAKGWEQEELCAASAVGLASLQKIELGQRQANVGTLEAMLTALGVDLATVDEQLAVIRKVRGGPPTGRAPRGEDAPATAGTAVRELLEIGRLLRPQLGQEGQRQAAPSFEELRVAAPRLWARLAAYPHAAQRALVREGTEFQDAGLCELLCDQSLNAAGDSSVRALRLAKLAALAAEGVCAKEGFRQRLAGYARIHVANALRVPGKLMAAKKVLRHGLDLWQAGAADDPGLLNEARVLAIEASLSRDCGERVQALALFDRALAADRWGETPALLIGKAKALEELGEFEASIALVRQAAALIDGEREPRRLVAVHVNLATNLCHLGQYSEAEQALPAVRALAVRLRNQLDDLRIDWLEARVAAGLGRTVEAVAGFERVRAGFAQCQCAYDAALVTLELAELHASLGRTADVKALARESALIFYDQGVHREAQRALDLFRLAAEEERASLDLIRGVLNFLLRARSQPRLRYQGPA
jgi:transcriptional regulator with XRE-family HTH domain